MSIEVEEAVLEKACKEMIETILFCLPSAFKGTIYRIGKPPELVAERITSGVLDPSTNRINWGLPSHTDYNPPGKPWLSYRDEPNRPLEAMGWCVEKQKSWTTEDPRTDARSVRLQVENREEDYNHMEPVLVHKSNLDPSPLSEYPRDHHDHIIWRESDYVVVAVIKIHFNPCTIYIGSHETRVIKKLSRSLGTELLSYQLRQDSLRAMQKLAKDRVNACDILADSLRNAITKSGLIFSLIKQEIGYLREQWEELLLRESKVENSKFHSINSLNNLLNQMNGDFEADIKNLINVHDRFLKLSLPPEKGVKWVIMQIENRWNELMNKAPLDRETTIEIREQIEKLKKSLYFGKDPDITTDYSRIPEDLKREWVSLLYANSESFNADVIERLIGILAHSGLEIPSRERSRKTLAQLKAIAETMSQLERNTNFLLRQVLNGGDNGKVAEVLETLDKKQKKMIAHVSDACVDHPR